MTDLLKKYWFVGLLSLCLLGITGYFIYDTYKDVLPGKKVNNQDIVYSINNIDVSADEIYDKLYDKYGISILYAKIEKAVADEAIPTTDEMINTAKLNAETIITNFQNSYGSTYETQLLNALRQVGYSKIEDLETYLIQSEKIRQIYQEYLEANPETTTAKYIEEKKPRTVSHILVQMVDSANPTSEELAKVKEVEEALASGTSFEEVAQTYSDDSSASSGGSLGYADADTSFVPEFLEAMLALNEGEVSDWVVTQYGYHIIKVNASTYESLKDLQEFTNGLNSFDPSIQYTAIWQKATELGIDFNGNTELETQLKEYMGIGE